MSVFLQSSKTDAFRRGHTLVIACSPSPLCAVKAMRNYFLLVRPQGPLFSFHSGRLLTRKSVVSLLRDAARQAGLPYSSLKGHSFRIGAASTAAAAGLPHWLIKVLGRWSSDSYQLYIHTPQTFSCLPHLVWRALPHISQHLFILLGGIHASHVSVAVKSRSDLPKLLVLRTTSTAISFSSGICQCLIVLQFSTCLRCRPKLLLYWLERIMNCLHSSH